MYGRETAKLDSFTLEIESIKDTIDKAIHEHESAYRDGALLEDMGAHAREIFFKCFFYEETYQDHYKFFEHVCQTTDRLYELEHPTYGIIFGKVRSVSINRDERTETAEIDIIFVEELQGTFSVIAPPVNLVGNQTETSFSLGQLQQMAQVASDMVDALGAEAQDLVKTVLDPAKSLVNSFINISISARAVLNTIDDALDISEGILSSVTIPANEAVSIFEYPSTLPGRIVSALSRVAARYAETIDNIADSPEHFISNLASSFDGVVLKFNDDGFPMQKHATIACAQSLALYASYRYSEDEERRGVMRQIEKIPAFDAAGNYLNPPDMPLVMNSTQLEQTLAAVRSRLQDGITASRSVTALKDMARQLLDHVRIVKLESENITTKTYSSEMPLHLICLREGLLYEYAERILSINPAIQNPSFVFGEVSVYA